MSHTSHIQFTCESECELPNKQSQKLGHCVRLQSGVNFGSHYRPYHVCTSHASGNVKMIVIISNQSSNFNLHVTVRLLSGKTHTGCGRTYRYDVTSDCDVTFAWRCTASKTSLLRGFGVAAAKYFLHIESVRALELVVGLTELL